MKKNPAMAWIDYKKAFDSVTHSWILESLNMTHLSRFVEYSMQDWKTELNHQTSCTKTDKISIKRGIFPPKHLRKWC